MNDSGRPQGHDPRKQPNTLDTALLFQGLRPSSLAAVHTAIQILELRHVSGLIIGKIGEDPGKPIDFSFTVGRVEVMHR